MKNDLIPMQNENKHFQFEFVGFAFLSFSNWSEYVSELYCVSPLHKNHMYFKAMHALHSSK